MKRFSLSTPARAFVGFGFTALCACGATAGPGSEHAEEECTPFVIEINGEEQLLPGACSGTPARAEAGEDPTPTTASAGESRSLGLPHDGTLQGGVKVANEGSIEYVASEIHGRNGGNFYGTDEMAGLLQRTAQTVRQRLRGAKLRIGEVSAPRGGRLPGHGSHQNGRDVDIAFLYQSEYRERIYAESFVPVDERGISQREDGVRYHFDARANWILVESLLLDPAAQVQYIFVADYLKRSLLQEASEQAAPDELKRLASYALREPDEHPHHNHFHVRIYCDPEDRPRCQDEGERLPPYGHRERPRQALRHAARRARELRLGGMAAGIKALREPPPREWRNAIPGNGPRSLIWPVREGRYGRGFGMTRVDLPDVPHNGVDIGAMPNSVIRAAATGLVVFAGEFRSFGNCIFLVHKNGWVTTYAHNTRNTVVPGELVRAGDPIALIGSTGISRGPHLHFEFRDRGMLRDPEEVLNQVRTWSSGRRLPQEIRPTNVEPSSDEDGDRRPNGGEIELPPTAPVAPQPGEPIRVPIRT